MATGDEINRLVEISVSWEKLHRELTQRDRDLLAREDAARQRSDEQHQQLRNRLDELIMMLGDEHSTLVALPCGHVQIRLNKMAADIECLKRNAIPWRAMTGWLNKRTLAAVVGAIAGWLGWDALKRAVDAWWK